MGEVKIREDNQRNHRKRGMNMNGRELENKLNYLGMSRGIRKLALKDNLASADELAVMSEVEVCELVAQNYQLVYSETEEIGLVHNDNSKKLFDMIEVISR